MSTRRTIDIDIKNNADQTAQDFDNLSQATNRAATSVDNLDATFEQVYGELQPLTTRMGEAEDRLYELALAGDTTSREYQQLLEKVGQYRKVQIETDLTVDAAATTLSQKLGGAIMGVSSGFAALQGVIGLVSTESEQLNKILLRVQSSLALVQGIQGVREAIPAFRQLGNTAANALKAIRTGIAATGIGLFVVAVGTLVAYWEDITELLGMNNLSLEEQLELEKKITEEKQKQLQEMNEIVSNNQDFINRQIQIVKNEEKLKSLSIDSEKNATKIRNLTKETIGLELQNLRARLVSTEELLSTQEKLQIKSEIYRKEQELLRVDEQALANQRKKNSTKKAKQDQKEIDDAKELARLRQEAMDREIDEEIELQRQLDQIQRENEDRFRTEQENEILLVEEKYDRLQSMAQGNAEALEQIEIARLNELNDIRNKFAEEEVQEAKFTAEEKRNFAIGAATDTFTTISNLAELFAGESKEQQKKAFKVQKAANIAQATVDTFSSAIAAYKSQAAIPVVGPVLGGIAAAAAVSAGLLNIKKISQQRFDSGGGTDGGGADFAPSGGGAQAPSFNVVGDSGVNQLAQLQQQPTQAFVVSGEVTTAQALDRNRIQNATL